MNVSPDFLNSNFMNRKLVGEVRNISTLVAYSHKVSVSTKLIFQTGLTLIYILIVSQM